MGKKIKIAIGVFGGIVLLVVVLLVGGFYLFFHSMSEQMETGRKVMDSIPAADFPVWIERSQKFISQGPSDTTIQDTDPRMPAELKQMKIIGIDIGTDYVAYVWMGGMDRTNLEV